MAVRNVDFVQDKNLGLFLVFLVGLEVKIKVFYHDVVHIHYSLTDVFATYRHIISDTIV